MARKNGNRHHKRPKLDIPRNHHFIFAVDEGGTDACVVRFLGEQDGDFLWCYHPAGYARWIHVSYLSNPPKAMAA